MRIEIEACPTLACFSDAGNPVPNLVWLDADAKRAGIVHVMPGIDLEVTPLRARGPVTEVSAAGWIARFPDRAPLHL